MQATKIMDANTASSYSAFAFSDVMAVYPITPSTPMAEIAEKSSALGKKNLFEAVPEVVQMQSEAGVAGAIHGSLTCGALASTFTSSQGLLLMIPNMYKIAGELLPGVIHVAARTLATHALSIFGDHSDIYACRQTGFAMLCANNAQEAMDFAAISHLCAIKSNIPFLHFFDGFRTSHEIRKVSVLDYEILEKMLDKNALENFKKRALSSENPQIRGTTQNEDIFFQITESRNQFYDVVPEIVENYMNELKKHTNRSYKPFEYYGASDAENIIIAMGSVCETIEETIDYLNQKGGKVGLIKVRLYRPFSAKHFAKVLPKSAKKISVLDRTKEAGSIGEPLFLDVLGAMNEFSFVGIKVFSGRYGLSSKETTPTDIFSVFENMENEVPKKRFTIGINDDVTYLSLKSKSEVKIENKNIYSCKFWGYGSDGTVSAVKSCTKIIGENTKNQIQANFYYDSKKSGGLTVSDLRFGKNEIKSAYSIQNPDFVAVHNEAYIFKYDVLKGLKNGANFLLNCTWNEENLNSTLPNNIKKYIVENQINFYIIDAEKISKEIGLGRHISAVMRAAFFKIANIFSENEAERLMKICNEQTFSSKGEKIVEINNQAIRKSFENLHKVDVTLLTFSENFEENKTYENDNYLERIAKPIEERSGNDLPVSAFLEYTDGSFPTFESSENSNWKSESELKRSVMKTPKWIPENCIQCGFCSFVCPHSVIRSAVLSDEELKLAPENIQTKKMIGFEHLNYSIVVSKKNCTSCGLCAQACPGMRGDKALEMVETSDFFENEKIFEFCANLKEKTEVLKKFPKTTVKGNQFLKPLLEFPSACAGCGETPYAKLVTQLFGSRLIIANATGCSSIWGGSSPTTPYTKNAKGQGPAWHNSLFEDNAEFGFGMILAQNSARKNILNLVFKLKDETCNEDLKAICAEYIRTFEIGEENQVASEKLINFLESYEITKITQEILKNKNFISKKSVWMFGGDGWAYDIGFGGLDHVVASGVNTNILIFDTEVYSNTGGQASKATSEGASAPFASFGKKTPKKNLAAMMMTYKNVYIAQIALGADYNQTLKAIIEAENFNGPSIVIAYSPCINHGIKKGMGAALEAQKMVVKSGYWPIFRFDPRKESPLQIDSKEVSININEFFESERRFCMIDKK